MIRPVKLCWISALVLVFVVACGPGTERGLNQTTPTPPEDFQFMGVQMGGGAQNPLQIRPSFPGDYCNVASRQGLEIPPEPFLYQPFEGALDEQTWAAQMDHDQPIYQQNGVIATLGEILRYNKSGPGLAGGTEAYGRSGKQWFKPDVPYTNVLQQGYPILAYQSPSFETYLYYDGHDGHDFAVTGKALAAADGGVVFAGDYGNALGRVVEIYHPQGYLTRYAHLASFESEIKIGTQVKAGQPIGTIGGSAVINGELIDNYWGTHLHFSVFRWAGSEWHITDPFGWDPWAGPDQRTHLQKQREDPLVACNGEVSYNLWAGGWPQPVTREVESTSFYPTQDRYVGGWLEEPIAPSLTSSTPIIVLIPLQVTKEKIDYKEGWARVTLQFVAENQGGKPFMGEWPSIGALKVKEGFTYEARMGGLTPWGTVDTENYNFGSIPVIPPRFRILTPPYVAEIAETTTPATITFEQFGEFNVESLASAPIFPTDLAESDFNQTPETIEIPGIARLTVQGFSPATSVEFSNPPFGNVLGEAAFMNITFENLNIGQDQELQIKSIAFLDGNGVVKQWDGTILYPGGLCDAGNRGEWGVGRAGTRWPFIAGPGQTRESQLCIRIGQVENQSTLSLNNLKVLLWINDEVWRVYDTGF
jgi:murein DD-endopeptidase MepM/ murein hydrolase activator NlpD